MMQARVRFRRLPSLALAVALVGAGGWAGAASASGSGEPAPAPQGEADAVIEYCLNIRDKAAEARAARQAEALKAVEARLEAKIRELEERRDEVRSWVEKQSALRSAAEAGLVEIYAAMEPEAASRQMATLDTRLATSLLAQLKPRIASAILNEMKPEKAASLVKSLAAASEREKRK